MFYRKIGGIHWFFLGRLRFAFCIVKRKPRQLPKARTLDEILDHMEVVL
jgi:hypothetical protein